jgi:hexosaminidase
MQYMLLFSLWAASSQAIWPIPVSYSSGNDTLWIDRDVQIIMNGVPKVGSLIVQDSLLDTIHQNINDFPSQGYLPFNSTDTTSPSGRILAASIERTMKTLFEQNFTPWKFHPRNKEFEPTTDDKCFVKTLTLTLKGVDAPNVLKPLANDVDESYTLSMPTSGAVEITANSSIGLAHGLTTFTQLFYKHSKGGVYSPLAPVELQDAPKFVHRGINMDVARNYFELDDIKRMIDAAAYNKLNRFHVHITDGQSWPLEIPALPELSEKGAYRSDFTYSPRDVAELQQYGALQGVQVYLETDMPGHTSSIAYSHPELIASFNKQPDWDTYAAEPPSGTLKLNSSAVSNFLETLFDDLLPRLTQYSAYYHTGGDEVNKQAYLNDDTVRSNDSAVLQPLMQKFIDRNHDQIRGYGFTPVVWEEMLLEWNLTLGTDVVVQTWQSDDALLQTVNGGHKGLAGNYNYWVCLFSSAQCH